MSSHDPNLPKLNLENLKERRRQQKKKRVKAPNSPACGPSPHSEPTTPPHSKDELSTPIATTPTTPPSIITALRLPGSIPLEESPLLRPCSYHNPLNPAPATSSPVISSSLSMPNPFTYSAPSSSSPFPHSGFWYTPRSPMPTLPQGTCSPSIASSSSVSSGLSFMGHKSNKIQPSTFPLPQILPSEFRGSLEQHSAAIGDSATLRLFLGVNSLVEPFTLGLFAEELKDLYFEYLPVASELDFAKMHSLINSTVMQKMRIALIEYDRRMSFILFNSHPEAYSNYSREMIKLFFGGEKLFSSVIALLIPNPTHFKNTLGESYPAIYSSFKRLQKAFAEMNTHKSIPILENSITRLKKKKKKELHDLIEEQSKAMMEYDPVKAARCDKKIKERTLAYDSELDLLESELHEKRQIAPSGLLKTFAFYGELPNAFFDILVELSAKRAPSQSDKKPNVDLPELNIQTMALKDMLKICHYFLVVVYTVQKPHFCHVRQYGSKKFYLNKNYKKEFSTIKTEDEFKEFMHNKYMQYKKRLLEEILFKILDHISKTLNIPLENAVTLKYALEHMDRKVEQIDNKEEQIGCRESIEEIFDYYQVPLRFFQTAMEYTLQQITAFKNSMLQSSALTLEEKWETPPRGSFSMDCYRP